jgi:uncharacterized Zn finger protein
LVELLQGRLSKGVMERICQQKIGLFPSPREIELSCSCPDWAEMCKHVAAVLYGIGARLDHHPELLFRLNQVNEHDLIAKAGSSVSLTNKGLVPGKVLSGDEDLSGLFGLDIQQGTPNNSQRSAAPSTRRSTAKPRNASNTSPEKRRRGPKSLRRA